jgi:hypothetical protein
MTLKTILTSTLLFSSVAGFAQQQQTQHSNIHLGLIYPLSSNGVQAKSYSNEFSLHGIAGVSASEKAFCASGAINVILEDADGAILGGFANHIGGNANGFVAGGFLNHIRYAADGMQAAGLANIGGSGSGFQAAGFANITRGEFYGVQTAGFINTAQNTILQLSGFANIGADVKTVQAAGFINVARDVNTQLAGFINIAKDVKGVQFSGFINIADSSDYPIGLINLVKKGEKTISLSVDDNMSVIGAFRSGGKKLYGIVGAGYNMSTTKLLYAMEAGIGAHMYTYKALRLNIEASATTLTDFWTEANMKSALRVYPTVKLGDKWEIFAGPSFNFSEYEIPTSKDFDTNYIWSNTYWGRFYGLSIGGFAGVQLHL